MDSTNVLLDGDGIDPCRVQVMVVDTLLQETVQSRNLGLGVVRSDHPKTSSVKWCRRPKEGVFRSIVETIKPPTAVCLHNATYIIQLTSPFIIVVISTRRTSVV